MDPLFDFDRVSVRIHDVEVLHAISLQVPATGVTVLAGGSGAGKSTTLRCCNRLEVPSEGVLRHRGEDVAGLDPLELRRRVAMVFQAPVAFPGTVAENLRAAADLTDVQVADLLDRVGLDRSFASRGADSLSGGQAQRMVIARALATSPTVLLADEPTSALDGTATDRLERLARQLSDDGLPVVWVTHDLDQMRRIADHLVVLDRGHVTYTGPPDHRDADAAIAESWRGERP